MGIAILTVRVLVHNVIQTSSIGNFPTASDFFMIRNFDKSKCQKRLEMTPFGLFGARRADHAVAASMG